MDNFMDKLAQRFNAQEMIRANAQAEAQELERLRQQVKAYDECMQEMRKLNLKNIEAVEQVKALAGQTDAMLKQMPQTDTQANEEKLEACRKLAEDCKKLLEENTEGAAALWEKMQKQQEAFEANTQKAQDALEEFMHKESVKVYRNVQASLQDELKEQTKELTEKLAETGKGNGRLLALTVLTLIASLGSVGLLIARIFGVI